MNTALYARVSTSSQSPEMQLEDLRRYAASRGFKVIREYVDPGVSGAKERRLELDKLMAAARRREFDTVLVWRFDRFARSVRHLVMALEEFDHLGIAFLSLQEALDTASPMGRAMFTVIAALAELERNLIVERVKSGLANARRRGKRLGRPPADLDLESARQLLAQGKSYTQVARELKISKTTLLRRIRMGRGEPIPREEVKDAG